VAATAYRLFEATDSSGRVVAIGPSHFFEFSGMATPNADRLATPLGMVPVDDDLRVVAESHAGVAPNRAAHAREHSLEVQLPFLQVAAGECAVLPLLTGRVEPATVADVLRSTLADGAVVGVISSDLSHYLDYESAQDRDQRTARTIEQRQPDRLSWGDACGLVGIQGALLLAQREGWECALLDLRSSGDTAGDRHRVVGYGSFVIGPNRSSRP
jgi:AmmeMemoRadiSam system protein B